MDVQPHAARVLLVFSSLDAAMPAWRSVTSGGGAATLALGRDLALESVEDSDYDVVLVAEDLVDRHGDALVAELRDASGAEVVVGAIAESTARAPSPVAAWGALRLDRARRLAWWRDASLHLTPKQFRLLDALVEARGTLLTVAELHEAVFDDRFLGDGERLFAHVRRVRALVEPDSANPVFLLTVRGEGFRLADAPEPVGPPTAWRSASTRSRYAVKPAATAGPKRSGSSIIG